MDEPSQNGHLREISGLARRAPKMSLEDARAMVVGGVPFCDVLPQVDQADEAALRAWFVRDEQVTIARRAAYLGSQPGAARAAYPSGEFCKCGGLMVQTGKCKTCTSCTHSEGSCS